MVTESVSFEKKQLHFDELDSTNNYLKQHGQELPHGTVVTADRQTMGKGRLGRKWEDDGRNCLKMSILLHDVAIADMAIIPAVVGIAVCMALTKLYGTGFQIKWPNDVILDGKKICGILCESRITGMNCFAVCGIGINLYQNEENFKSEGLLHAGSIFSLRGIVPNAEEVRDAVVNELDEYYNRYKESEFDSVVELYKNLSATVGKEVSVIQGDLQFQAFAENIGSQGQLLCRYNDEIIEVQSGEASVRGLYGYI